MAIITNALDAVPFEAQLEFTRNRFDPDAYFAQHGFDPSLIDLRRYAGREDALRQLLLRFKVIWAVGGNTFLLRRAMRESGFDRIIGDLLKSGIVYGGWSAGACVAGDNLQAVGLMDEPHAEAPGYLGSSIVWEGLNLVPFSILPHYRSDHPEAPMAAKAVDWAAKQKIEFRALRDGDVLIVENGGAPTLLLRTR